MIGSYTLQLVLWKNYSDCWNICNCKIFSFHLMCQAGTVDIDFYSTEDQKTKQKNPVVFSYVHVKDKKP